MTPTASEIFEAAKALPREERAEVTNGLIATLGTSDISSAARQSTLQAAVDTGLAEIDAGKGIRIPSGGLRAHLRERGRLAAERAAAKTV